MHENEVDQFEVRVVEADRVRPLRRSVLRPHQAIEQMVYPGDDAPGSFHLAAVDGSGEVLGIASFYSEPHPLNKREGDWRLRGMAVVPRLQGKGLGGRLVHAGISHIREQGGQRLWCKARVTAQRFYEKLGFIAEGDRFEIATIGPHYVMSIAVGPRPR